MDTGLGIGLGLTAAASWGVTEVIAAIVARRAGSLRTTAWIHVTALVFLVALLVITGTPLPEDPGVIVASLLWGTLAGVAYLAFYTSLRHGPVTVTSPIVAMYGGMSVVLAVVLLNEPIATPQVIGVVIAVTGVVLASIVLEPGGRRPRVVGPGVAYAVVAMVLFGVHTVGIAPVIEAGGWLPVLALSRVANTATAWGVLFASRSGRFAARRERATVPAHARLLAMPMGEVVDAAIEPEIPAPGATVGARRDVRILVGGLVTGILDACGYAAFAIGLALVPVWLIGIVSSFGPVVTVVAGVALFGERPRPIQWLGLFLVLASILLIGLA
jgi:drug/metabolite transporter (DMT)-like permease